MEIGSEILIAANDFQKFSGVENDFSSKSRKSDLYTGEKSFSELLASFSSEPEPKKADVKETPPEKTFENQTVASEKEKPKSSENESVKNQSEVKEKSDDKLSKNELERDSEVLQKEASYIALENLYSENFVKTENEFSEKIGINLSENSDAEIGTELLQKIAGKNDVPKITIENIPIDDENRFRKFEFVQSEELETDDLLLASQELSVQSPLEFLENIQNLDKFIGSENNFTDSDNKFINEQNSKVSKESDIRKKITVTDLRTKNQNGVDEKNQVAQKSEKDAPLKVKTVITASDSATITMDLNRSAENFATENILSSNSQVAASDGSNFQAMLNNQIAENASEFVKAGNIVLKDNGKGTINLVLHPDDLGKVRLHLSMDGKTISGHITVNTQEALEVFRDNAQTLREAFIKSGFADASFDVSFSNNSGGGNEFNQHENNEQKMVMARKEYISENDINLYDGEEFSDFENFGKYSVNIVA